MSRIVRIKRASMLWLMAALFCAPPAFAQESPPPLHAYHIVIPLDGGVTRSMIRAAVASSATIPMWEYTVTSPLDGRQYSGTMVGRSPFFHGARTTAIPTVIIPIVIKMPDGTVFDPTAADPSCLPAVTALSLVQKSPLFNSIDITMGPTDVGVAQYVDAFQRANFWNEVSPTGNRYHTTLSPVTTSSAIAVTVLPGDGATNSTVTFGGCGGDIGVLNLNWWDADVQNNVLPQLAAMGLVGPTVFPIFLFYNVVMNDGATNLSGNCCILGYHGAESPPVQTYAVADYDTTGIFGDGTHDISDLSHEVGEWMDDPLGTNPTPDWGHIGQVSDCQNNLEVGDPLSGTLFPGITMNGYTYNPQELAFFSWFYRQSPSIGVNRWYSDNDTFVGDAGPICK